MIHYINGSVLYKMKHSKCVSSDYRYSPCEEFNKTTYNDDKTIPASFYSSFREEYLTCSYYGK